MALSSSSQIITRRLKQILINCPLNLKVKPTFHRGNKVSLTAHTNHWPNHGKVTLRDLSTSCNSDSHSLKRDLSAKANQVSSLSPPRTSRLSITTSAHPRCPSVTSQPMTLTHPKIMVSWTLSSVNKLNLRLVSEGTITRAPATPIRLLKKLLKWDNRVLTRTSSCSMWWVRQLTTALHLTKVTHWAKWGFRQRTRLKRRLTSHHSSNYSTQLTLTWFVSRIGRLTPTAWLVILTHLPKEILRSNLHHKRPWLRNCQL